MSIAHLKEDEKNALVVNSIRTNIHIQINYARQFRRLLMRHTFSNLSIKEKYTKPVRTAYNIIPQTNPDLALSVRGNGQSRLALDVLLTQIYISV